MRVGRERLREFLHKHEITFQRTKTWKETTDPNAQTCLPKASLMAFGPDHGVGP